MAGIVALRGTDCGCGLSDSSSTASAVVPPTPKMPLSQILIWTAAIGTVGYIFWATLQPKSRRLVT
jgi:hypothetical protein